MPFSHHSHSGQFCGHAVNTLEEVVQNAISKGLHTFCLTEHIPRDAIDFYPEESETQTEASLIKLYDDFHLEARRLQEKYKQQIQLFVGFESEWIRESTLQIIQTLFDKHVMDMFIGSVHHMHTIPIDYDAATYHKARNISGGSDEALFSDYFDEQLRMLEALQPPIVGHLDLIRLKSDDPERSFTTWPTVWSKILRNLAYIASYEGVLELNSASIRKGMTEPYPKVEICKEFLALGGSFTLSDDSHGTDHVALNFDKTLLRAQDAGISQLSYLVNKDTPDSKPLPGTRFDHVAWKTVSILEVIKSFKTTP